MWTLKVFYFSLLVMFFVIITSQEEKIKPVNYEFVPRGTLALIHKGNLKIEINTEGILSDFEALLQTIEKIAIKTEDLNHRQSLSTLGHQMMKTLRRIKLLLSSQKLLPRHKRGLMNLLASGGSLILATRNAIQLNNIRTKFSIEMKKEIQDIHTIGRQLQKLKSILSNEAIKTQEHLQLLNVEVEMTKLDVQFVRLESLLSDLYAHQMPPRLLEEESLIEGLREVALMASKSGLRFDAEDINLLQLHTVLTQEHNRTFLNIQLPLITEKYNLYEYHTIPTLVSLNQREIIIRKPIVKQPYFAVKDHQSYINLTPHELYRECFSIKNQEVMCDAQNRKKSFDFKLNCISAHYENIDTRQCESTLIKTKFHATISKLTPNTVFIFSANPFSYSLICQNNTEVKSISKGASKLTIPFGCKIKSQVVEIDLSHTEISNEKSVNISSYQTLNNESQKITDEFYNFSHITDMDLHLESSVDKLESHIHGHLTAVYVIVGLIISAGLGLLAHKIFIIAKEKIIDVLRARSVYL